MNRQDDLEIRPGMEPLTPEELEAFLSRARAQGRALTSEEQYALFGPPSEKSAPAPQYTEIEEMASATLAPDRIAQLQANFFPELGNDVPRFRLLRGIIFDFDHTLAYLARSLDDLMEEGAKAAEAYMRANGMDDLPADFWTQIIEARLFAEEKSEEEQEEHIADDAMSFLLQFYGYPASRLDPVILRTAVDIFYAPEMSAWRALPGAIDMLKALHEDGYKLALLAHHNCDRVFQRIVDYLGFRPYLDLVMASASVEYRKPNDVFFNVALDHWALLPYEVVIVGDSLRHDIGGGIDLGALTVQVELAEAIHATSQVKHDNAQVAEQVKADAIVRSLAELPAIVQQWAGA